MCGRYALVTPADVLAKLFELTVAGTGILPPRYNIAPTQEVPVIRRLEPDGPRRLDALRWGLVPSWAKDPSIGGRMINARSETAASKPAFRAAFRRRRCAVPADGFYEWKKTGDLKQPWYIHRRDGHPMLLAGLWEHWEAGGTPLETFTICTTDANDALAPLHERMPVILEPGALDAWLDPDGAEPGALAALLRPAGNDVLSMHPVSRRVNRPANEGPDLIEAVDEHRPEPAAEPKPESDPDDPTDEPTLFG